ncbi:MAG: chemotaxis protein CheA [Chloroflexota bacterium]|nr:chemotaxis protein CheA [Chloroflexota bacterium]
MGQLSFDADDEELALFLAENNDHLQALDQHIVQLETQPDDQALLQSIFRSAHTIKGGAGMIGHARMAALAHAMENVLDALRAHTFVATPAIVDALLAALDGLRTLNDEVISREESPLVIDDMLAALADCLVAGPASTTGSAGAPPVPGVRFTSIGTGEQRGETLALPNNASALDEPTYRVAVAVDPACGLSAARTLQAYLELARTTRVISVRPTPAQIEADELTCTLDAVVATGEAPSLLELRLSGVPDVLSATVALVDESDSSDQETVAAETLRDTGGDTSDDTAPPRETTAPVSIDASLAGAPAVVAAKPVGGAPRAGSEKTAQETIRISVSIVDDLMNLASELVLDRTRLASLRARLHDAYPADATIDALGDAVAHLDGVCADLQATVMKARMLPVENVFNKFPRLIRDLSAQVGKKVSFTMHGQDTELDRSVIEQLSDPLVHMLRNAVDHGLETPEERRAAGKSEAGAVTLSAAPRESSILITIQDDGRGIDGEKMKAGAVEKGFITAEEAAALTPREAVELVFAAGLSTARRITDISGRGVGMDIVKATLERMGGHVAIETVVGQGTTFLITLPLTLAIMQALLVSVDDSVYALPLTTVTEILTLPTAAIQTLQGTDVTVVRGTILPIVRLRDYYGRAPAAPAATCHVVATRVDGQPLGLMVDHFIGEQEIVMKPLGTALGPLTGLAGATILGDGRIGLLVDVAALKEWRPSYALSA